MLHRSHMLLVALIPGALLACSETLSDAPPPPAASNPEALSAPDESAGPTADTPANPAGEAPVAPEAQVSAEARAAIEASLRTPSIDGADPDAIAAATAAAGLPVAALAAGAEGAEAPQAYRPPGEAEAEVIFAPGFVPEGGFEPQARTIDLATVEYNLRQALAGLIASPDRVIRPGEGFTLQALTTVAEPAGTVRAELFGDESFEFVDPAVAEMLESGRLVVLTDGRVTGAAEPSDIATADPEQPPTPRDFVGDNPRMLDTRGGAERITCTHPESFVITGDGARVTLMGICGTVLIETNGTDVRLQTAERVIVTGNGNAVVWTDSVLVADDYGADNRIGPTD